jgi:hypothetical protein
MATTAQLFYPSTTEQDFTAPSEVDIRKLVESAPGSNSTTITSHPNAAGTTQITLDPYTNRSTTGDIRANAGWAINAAGADGMDSTSTEKRIIPSGQWQIVFTAAMPVAGTGTGTLTLTMSVTVYRVSAAGARSSLFTMGSTSAQSTGLAAFNGIISATSGTQPEYVLEAGETIHVGILTQVVQVAGLAGATVAGTVTWTTGTATQYFRLPTPGVRTQRIRGVSDTVTTVSDGLTRVQASNRTLTETIPTTESITRQMAMSRTITDNIPTTDALVRSVGLNRGMTEDLATGGGGTTIITTNIFSVFE